MSNLPEIGYITIEQIIGNKRAKPPIPAIYPVGRSTLYNQIKEGIFPKPTKLGLYKRRIGWKVEVIKKFLDDLN